MKKTLLTVFSILLILASLFGIVAAGLGIKDGLAIKQYKEDDAKAADVVGDLEEAIGLLKDNEDDYNNGRGDYSKGLVDYAAGEKALNEGYAAYNEGLKTLEAGKAEYEAGKKQIEENTAAYNEGKELLGKIEPLMPMLDTYVKFRDGSVAKLPGFDSAQAWFVSVVRPMASGLGLDIPADVTDFPAYMQNMVAEGKAMLKQYEDGLAQLAQAEKDIAAGEAALKEAEAQLAAGEKELAAGGSALAQGKADLEAFEEGMRTADGYTMICFKNEPIYRHNGEMAVPGPEQRLGEDYSWYKYDENGELVTTRSGDPYLDLDKCLVVCSSFRESVADHVADVTHELYMRLGLYVALIITSILGLIAGIKGLKAAGSGEGIKGACTLGLVTAGLAIACNIFGLFTRYLGYTYPLKDGTYSGTVQLIGLIVLAVAAVLFAVTAISAKSKLAKEAAAN